MALSRRNGRSRATLLFLVLTSVTVITLDFRDDGGGIISSLRDGATDAFAPVRDAADAVFSPIGDTFSTITERDDLEDQIAELQAELDEVEGVELRAGEAEARLQELLELNGRTHVGELPTVLARVVSVPVSNFEQTIELDRGTDDGVEPDMPVVTGAGLVGRVIRASAHRSVVLLVTDSSSSVGVRVGTNEIGIAEGRGAGRTLSVALVDIAAEIQRRTVAVTSGLEGGSDVFPPGLPVGRVVRAETPAGELQQTVELEPVADFDRLRYVRVVQVPQ